MAKRGKEDTVIAENYILVGIFTVLGLLAVGVGSWFTLRGVARPARVPAGDLAAAGPGGIVQAVVPQIPAIPVPDVLKPAAVLPPPALPPGWSYNTPAMGFRAAWPVPPGPDGFTPIETTFGNVSVKSNTWSVERDGVLYHVDYTDFPAITAEEGVFIDATHQRIYDNAARRASARGQQALPPFRPWAPIRWLGHNARQVFTPGEGRMEKLEGRAIIFGTKMYHLELGGPKSLWDEKDARLATFFETFAGH